MAQRQDDRRLPKVFRFFLARNLPNLRQESSSLVSTSLTHSGDDDDSEDSGIISLFSPLKSPESSHRTHVRNACRLSLGLLLLPSGQGWSESTCGRLSEGALGSALIGVAPVLSGRTAQGALVKPLLARDLPPRNVPSRNVPPRNTGPAQPGPARPSPAQPGPARRHKNEKQTTAQ